MCIVQKTLNFNHDFFFKCSNCENLHKMDSNGFFMQGYTRDLLG